MADALQLASPAQAVSDPAEAEKLADKLLGYQAPDGAVIVDAPSGEQVRVIPYFGNLAALGWTETAATTTDVAKRDRYLRAARDWMDWYAAHQNADGTIYDFEGTSTSLHATGEYDSTDSYPATYAMLMARYLQAAGDPAYVRARQASIDGAYSAMFLTVDRHGLTYAKPGYSMRYLMDNCEVAAGLAAFGKIFAAMDRPQKAQQARAALEHMKPAFGAMFRQEAGAFGVALDPFGGIVGSFTKGYPDAMANLFVLAILAPGSAEAGALLDKLEAKFWDQPDAQDFPQWWLLAALACDDRELQRKAAERLRRQAESRSAHSFVVGMAAAIFSTGMASVRTPDAVCEWSQLTTQWPKMAVGASFGTLAGRGTGVVINYHKAAATIAGEGWRADSLNLPAEVAFEMTTSTANFTMNMVFEPRLDLHAAGGFHLAFSAPADAPLQLRAAVIDKDARWWIAPVGGTHAGENSVQIDFAKLTPKAPKSGSGDKMDLESVRGIRLEFHNRSNGPVRGALALHELSIPGLKGSGATIENSKGRATGVR